MKDFFESLHFQVYILKMCSIRIQYICKLKYQTLGTWNLQLQSIKPLPQKTSPLHYALQTSVTRNKRYHLPTITNNRTQCNNDCKRMPIAWSNKMMHFLSLQRSQEERLENYHALKPVCNNRNKHGWYSKKLHKTAIANQTQPVESH